MIIHNTKNSEKVILRDSPTLNTWAAKVSQADNDIVTFLRQESPHKVDYESKPQV